MSWSTFRKQTTHWKGLNVLFGGLLFALSYPLAAPYAFAKSAGTEAADFLKIGASGRQTAMGDAAVGLADDANASLSNPAAWGRLRRNEVSLLRTEWLEQITYTGAMYGHSTESLGNWGAGFLWLDVPNIQGYDITGRPQRAVEAGDRVVMAGHGQSFGTLSLGGTVKYAHQTLGTQRAGTWAGDAGLHWRTPWGGSGQKFMVGAALRNAGGKIKFIEKTAPLPTSVDVGLAYQALNNALTLDADASFGRAATEARLGGEYWIRNMLAFRLGFKPGQDAGNGLSFGFGVRMKQVYLDYAFADFGRLEGTHRLSLRLRFGGVVAATYKKALRLAQEEHYPQALRELDKILVDEPYNPEALSQLRSLKQIYELRTAETSTKSAFSEAQIFFRQRRYLSALDKFLEALADQPERETEIRHYVAIIGAEMQGEEALSDEEHAELKELLGHTEEKSVVATPLAAEKTEEGALATAKNFYKKEQYLRANEVLMDLQKNAPDPAVRAEAKKLLAKILTLMSDQTKRPDSRDPKFHYAVAFLSYLNQRNDQAITYWRRVLELTPTNEEVRSYLDSTQEKVSAGLQKERLQRLLESGSSHYQAGRYESALEAWTQAARLTPDNPELLSLLRNVKTKLNERNVETSAKQYFERAKLYYETGQWNRAIELLEKMQTLKPLTPEAKDMLTRARQQKALAQEAARRKREAAKTTTPPVPATPVAPTAQPSTTVARDPSMALSLYQRGLIAYAQGNIAESIRLWQQSLTLNPDNIRVKKALERALAEQESQP